MATKTILSECILEFMEEGAIGVGWRDEVIAHTDEQSLAPYAYIIIYYENDFPLLDEEAMIEKIPEGWLIDGVLYNKICNDPCHDRLGPD